MYICKNFFIKTAIGKHTHFINDNNTFMDKNRAASSYDWSSKSILIVDDLEIIFNYYKLAISRTGVRLYWTDNGTKAIEYIKKEPGIDLVLMDIQMPGMDGYETGKEIKKMRPELPIIIQTAYVLEETEQKAFDNGMDGYLSKPIKLNLLLNLIDNFFKKN
jgi:CheY-like chemotaxis protein